MPEETQGRWLQWTVAQELFRRRCIAGEEIPELLLFWQSKEHELDFVVEPGHYLEVKRGKTTPVEFAWFERVLPRSKLLVVGDSSFESRSVRGLGLADFLREV